MAKKGKEALDLTVEKLDVCLKKKQLEAAFAFLSGKDVLVSLLTGYGKSLAYGILPIDQTIPSSRGRGWSHETTIYSRVARPIPLQARGKGLDN